MSGIYNIYVNPAYEKSYDGLLLHEVGHIIFGHLQSNAFNEKTFEMKLKFAWARIRKLISIGDDVKLSEKEIQDIYLNKVKQIMLNYAMDYEVNSKLFTPEEWAEQAQKFEYDWMKIQYEDDNISEEFYEETFNIKKDDPTKKLVSALWPEDVGFPLKLQFTQYIDLMIRDPEKFFEKLLLLNPPPMSGNGGDDQDDGSQGQDGKSKGKGSGNSKKNKNQQGGQGDGGDQSGSEDEKSDEQSGVNAKEIQVVEHLNRNTKRWNWIVDRIAIGDNYPTLYYSIIAGNEFARFNWQTWGDDGFYHCPFCDKELNSVHEIEDRDEKAAKKVILKSCECEEWKARYKKYEQYLKAKNKMEKLEAELLKETRLPHKENK